MKQNDFFQAKQVVVNIRPRSPAHRMLFWFLYGHDPARITMAVYGEFDWCLPKPFVPTFFGGAWMLREGSYSR